MNFNKLSVGDYVVVEYTDGDRFKGNRLKGEIVRIWTPQEHSAGCWQAEMSNGWCFHAGDELLEHRPIGDAKEAPQT